MAAMEADVARVTVARVLEVEATEAVVVVAAAAEDLAVADMFPSSDAVEQCNHCTPRYGRPPVGCSLAPTRSRFGQMRRFHTPL